MGLKGCQIRATAISLRSCFFPVAFRFAGEDDVVRGMCVRSAFRRGLFLLFPIALFYPADGSAAERAGPIGLSPPVIEVVSFGVAPVNGLAGNPDLYPKAGDLVYRRRPPAGNGSRTEFETRASYGETWSGLFARLGDRFQSDILASPQLAAQAHLLPPLLPGKYLRFQQTENGTLQIDYVVAPEEAYSITLAEEGVQVRRQVGDPRIVERMRSDPSKASLFTATDAVGLPEEIVLQLVEIFADEVDFHRELHQGYRCTIVYEVLYREGHVDRAGRILAAEFIVGPRRLEAYYFDDGAGRSGYFSETGKSLKKAFRISPVEFSRVTSEYTLARFHPVLGVWRAHRGTDYAAPVGTRVIATADGVVDFIGRRGEYGNLLVLRHYDRYRTYYGHLDRFAGGLTEGSRVKKGQVVGYVGMTGLATGPHVHYEFRVLDASGEWTSVPAPQVLEAPPIDSPAFFSAIRTYRAQLQVAERTHIVTLD